MENPINVFDLTISEELVTKDTLIQFFSTHAKKWAFQLEKGEETDYLHYQIRISTKVKKRLSTFIKWFGKEIGFKGFRASATSGENATNDFYVTKEETRVEGPWSDKDSKVNYIPMWLRQARQWYPWQITFMEYVEDYDPWNPSRSINVFVDPTGNNGKSTICLYLAVRGKLRVLPALNDAKDMMRIIMDTPKKPCYVFDLPRAQDKKFMHNFIAACEVLKNGYAYDDRYHFKEEYFDPPNIWIFTNQPLDETLLSSDRWRYWHLNENNELEEG